MKNTADQEFIDTLLSQTKILYTKIDNQFFNVQKTGEVEGNNLDTLSNILFPFNALCCQHLFFVSFDEEQDDNKFNHTLLLYSILKCWEYALKKRKEYLERLKSKNVKAAHFIIEEMKDIRQQEFLEKEKLMRALIDYMRGRLDCNFWEQYDILMGDKFGQILYGSSNLGNNSTDLAIPFIISNNLLEEFNVNYPFHVQASSITILKILQLPFSNITDKITYNSDKLVGDKVLPVKDTRMEDGIQINNLDSIYRNSLEENIKHEHENNDYNKLGKEER